MAPRIVTPKGKPSDGYPVGFQVVLGPRSSLPRWGERPWAEIVAAAQRGEDGLRLEIFTLSTSAADQEFMLRELPVGPTSAFHGRAGLFQQRW